MLSMYFPNYLHLQKDNLKDLIWTNLNRHHPRIICPKRLLISDFSLLSRLGKGCCLHIIWTKLNRFIQECFVHSWIEMGLAVLKKNISKCCQHIYAISLLSPFWNMAWPFISRNFHSHHSKMDLLRQVWLKLTFKCWWLLVFCLPFYL